jgi:hypothetical protein
LRELGPFSLEPLVGILVEAPAEAVAVAEELGQIVLVVHRTQVARGRVVGPPADTGVVEGLDLDLPGIQLAPGIVVVIEQIPQSAVVVSVAVRADHRVQADGVALIVPHELPVHEVGGALAGGLLGAGEAAVDQHVPVVRRPDQHAVALADVDEIELEQGVFHQRDPVHVPLEAPRPDAHPRAGLGQ